MADYYTPAGTSTLAVAGTTYAPGQPIPAAALLQVWSQAQIDAQVAAGVLRWSPPERPLVEASPLGLRSALGTPGLTHVQPTGEVSIDTGTVWQPVGGQWNRPQEFNEPVQVKDGLTANALTATGAVQAGSVAASGAVAAGSVNASGQVQGATVRATGALQGGSASVSGAVAAGSVNASGQVAAGSVQAGSAQVSGQMQAGSVNTSGQVQAGSVQTGAVGASSANVSGQVAAGSVQAGSVGANSAQVSGQVQAGSVAAGSGQFNSLSSPTIDNLSNAINALAARVSALEAQLSTVQNAANQANAAAATAQTAANNAANAATSAQNAANQANSSISGLQAADNALSNRIGSIEGLNLGTRVPALEAKTANLPDFTFYNSNMTALANVISQVNGLSGTVTSLRNAYNGHTHYYTDFSASNETFSIGRTSAGPSATA